MSDTLQESEDQIMEEEANEREIRRIRRARLAAKESPQTNQHQVTKSGTCVIPGCPCRGWSAQETASTNDDKPHCVCGSWLHAHQNETGRCLWPHCGCQKFELAVEHQSAARGGGDGGDDDEDRPPMTDSDKIGVLVVATGEQTLIGALSWIQRRQREHQALVAERERLLETLRELTSAIVECFEEGRLSTRARLAASKGVVVLNEQRSTPQ